MFGLSLTKLLVLALAIYGAWQLFRWFERRGSDSGAPPPPEPRQDETDKAVEMEQDPQTGVWRPKDRD